MSGSMMPPGGGQGGQPQLPPQLMAMLMQMRGGQGGAAPGGMGAGMPQAPSPQQGMTPPGQPQPQAMGTPNAQPPQFQGVGGAAAQNPNLAMFARAAQMGAGGPLPRPGGQQRLTPQEMAHLGRFGDQVVGHLTPGEIAVPPELQTPKVLATLDKAFDKAGVSQQQFTAGSPQSSVNPNTGAPEYSLWSALLPILGAAAGSFIPGIGTAAGMAIGGGLGGAAGGLIDKTGPAGAALGALGGAAGGYMGGGGLSDLLGGGAGAAMDTSGAVTNAATNAPFTAGASGIAPSVDAALGNAANATGSMWGSGTGAIAQPVNWSQLVRGGLGAGMGAGMLSSLAPANNPAAQLPPGFSDAMHPINRNFNQLLGNGRSSTPNFAGYDPIAAVSGLPYRFYQ